MPGLRRKRPDKFNVGDFVYVSEDASRGVFGYVVGVPSKSHFYAVRPLEMSEHYSDIYLRFVQALREEDLRRAVMTFWGPVKL